MTEQQWGLTTKNFGAELAKSKSPDTCEVVVLIQGWNNFGDEVYSYVKVPVEKLDEIKHKLDENEPLDVRKYGTVIAAGLNEPSDEVKAEIEKEYDMHAI